MCAFEACFFFRLFFSDKEIGDDGINYDITITVCLFRQNSCRDSFSISSFIFLDILCVS